MILICAILSCLLAVIPAALFVRNLSLYRRLPPIPTESPEELPAISVLIPARNEEANISAAIQSVQQSRNGVRVEILVLDDDSTDGTERVVTEICKTDPDVRLHRTVPLPSGWCGKNHACHQLAKLARFPLLLFMDADVRITAPDALARLVRQMETEKPPFLSSVPRQLTYGLMEQLIIPLIHFILLAFLPIQRMRQRTDPSLAAACGQILAVRRDAYLQAGGHEAIADRLHDAVALARSFRRQQLLTDLFDATDTFSCRMYHRSMDVWNGFLKNAHEGLGSPALVFPMTIVLLGGQILPFLLLMIAQTPVALILSGTGVAAALLPRILGAIRFHQSWLGACLHPLGVLLLVTIQWSAFFRALLRRSAGWKGRFYPRTSKS